ncbi:MAG: DUF192 domain-containing protein [Nanoarchaeota archaeon]|nr:DUF192 domain-containing protein [Nanoarchaeota archaeon]
MIINKTSNQIISHQELICSNVLSQSLGLMFHPRKNLVMIFPTEQKISIHTFFVFYPIDIVVVNKEKKVVEIKKNLRPCTFWNSSQQGKYLLELAFSSTNYNLGDTIEMNPKK